MNPDRWEPVNEIKLDLSEASFEAVVKAVRDMVGDRRKMMRLSPKYLLVSSENLNLTRRILFAKRWAMHWKVMVKRGARKSKFRHASS